MQTDDNGDGATGRKADAEAGQAARDEQSTGVDTPEHEQRSRTTDAAREVRTAIERGRGDGSEGLNRDSFRKWVMVPALEAAGLSPRVRTHDLRHTCASLLISLGAHPKAIQERLGHSDISVTLNLYGHLFPSLEEQLTDALDDLGRSAGQSDPPDNHE